MIDSNPCATRADLLNRLNQLNALPDSAFKGSNASQNMEEFLKNNKDIADKISQRSDLSSVIGEAFEDLAKRISKMENGTELSEQANKLAETVREHPDAKLLRGALVAQKKPDIQEKAKIQEEAKPQAKKEAPKAPVAQKSSDMQEWEDLLNREANAQEELAKAQNKQKTSGNSST